MAVASFVGGHGGCCEERRCNEVNVDYKNGTVLPRYIQHVWSEVALTKGRKGDSKVWGPTCNGVGHDHVTRTWGFFWQPYF